jgi:zona occludens toxin
MLSDAVDWSQVVACVANKNNCVCYGFQAQRLNIVPDTCYAAIKYGWLAKQL